MLSVGDLVYKVSYREADIRYQIRKCIRHCFGQNIFYSDNSELFTANWTLPAKSPVLQANALSIPPEEYGRKIKTQMNRRGPAQAVDHVV